MYKAAEPMILFILQLSYCFGVVKLDHVTKLFKIQNVTYDVNFQFLSALGNKTVKSLISCSKECLQTENCLSFLYNAGPNQCVLHDTLLDVTPLDTADGWKLYSAVNRTARCMAENNFMFYSELDICYSINTASSVNFEDMKAFCGKYSAEMIRVDSLRKQAFVQLITETIPIDYIMIQGTPDNDHEDQWLFDDGTVMRYFNMNWDQDEPNEDGTNIGIQKILDRPGLP